MIREMRLTLGLSQRELARRARTSQSAIARYENGVATPSLGTLQRLAVACGHQLKIDLEAAADPHDVQLAQSLLGLTPLERLRSLTEYAHLRELVER